MGMLGAVLPSLVIYKIRIAFVVIINSRFLRGFVNLNIHASIVNFPEIYVRVRKVTQVFK